MEGQEKRIRRDKRKPPGAEAGTLQERKHKMEKVLRWS